MSEPAAAPETEAASSGPSSKLPLIGAIVIGLAVGAGSGAMVVGPMITKKMGVAGAPIVAPAEHASAEGEEAPKEEASSGEHGGGKKEGAGAPPVTLLENLVLNPASSGGTRYLLMSIAIESSDAASAADFTARDAELKDLILSTLASKTVDSLSDISAREGIKTELIDAITKRFGKKAVKQLYFPQFVIQ